MFGLSFGEILVILVVGLLVLGPSRMPKLARSLGKGLREFRRATGELRSTFEEEFYKLDQEPEQRAKPPAGGAGEKAAAAPAVAAGAAPEKGADREGPSMLSAHPVSGETAPLVAPPEGVVFRNEATAVPLGAAASGGGADRAQAGQTEAEAVASREGGSEERVVAAASGGPAVAGGVDAGGGDAPAVAGERQPSPTEAAGEASKRA